MIKNCNMASIVFHLKLIMKVSTHMTRTSYLTYVFLCYDVLRQQNEMVAFLV